MTTLRNIPLVDPFEAQDRFVLLDDTEGTLWWIDHEGDLLFWDDPTPPDDPFEIRRAPGFRALADAAESAATNALIEAAFAASQPVPEADWDALFDAIEPPEDALTLDDLKETPLKALDAAIKDVPVAELAAWVRQLDDEIADLTRLAAYLGQRCGYGQGDQGHAKGVKASNRIVRAVRRVLGYHTTPDVTF